MIAILFYLKKSMLNFQKVIHSEYLTDVKKTGKRKIGFRFHSSKSSKPRRGCCFTCIAGELIGQEATGFCLLKFYTFVYVYWKVSYNVDHDAIYINFDHARAEIISKLEVWREI